MSDSKRVTVDHWSFVKGVKNPLGRLADACLDAYEENGNPLLEEAANALRAIETVDLSRCICIKCENISPLPWRMNDDDSGPRTIDEPILDVYGRAVVKTDCGCYPPEWPVSEAIVDCMNTVHALQTKNGD